MNKNLERIYKLINQITTHLLKQLSIDENGEVRFIDPNEKKEISAHYGVSHLAASLLLLADGDSGSKFYSKGRSLLCGLIKRWDFEHTLSAYHFDFNNFALILCYDNLSEEDILKNQLRDIILRSPDSSHDTINWLPMRLVVNARRLKWTGDEKYYKIVEKCKKLIKQATNKDGGIEDRLPKGVSFNLQYDISSLATLCFASEIMPEYDINNGLNFLLKNIAPDGDINYQGRGCNQVFAWGPWIYLLSSFKMSKELENALDYLEPRLLRMINNDSMMLNEWPGSEKFLWWDYHYASVYSAHILLWLLLAVRNTKYYSHIETNYIPENKDTGLLNIRTENFSVSVFEGRREYLAEYGPMICLLWTKRNGNIFKGGFAPWRGLFGMNNSFDEISIMNYFGLFVGIKPGPKGIIGKLKRKIVKYMKKNKREPIKYYKMPIFCPININYNEKRLTITWILDEPQCAYANIPSLCDNIDIKISVDNKEYPIYLIGKFRNQYDWLELRQTRIIRGSIWKVTFAL